MRRFFVLILVLALLALSWLRGDGPVPDERPLLRLEPLLLDAGCCRSGPLRLEQAWELHSANSMFGGYSALVRSGPGRFLAFSDRGYFAEFPEPGTRPGPVRFGSTADGQEALKRNRDVESAVRDPVSGHVWLALEGRNAMARYSAGLTREALRIMPEWQDWPRNSGPESMARLADGRFVVVCECRTTWLGGDEHPAFVYPGDPVSGIGGQAFTLEGIAGYRPTDMAQLPDGRVLILVRRLVWPIPARFAIKVLIADPAEIARGKAWHARELAEIADPWPVDNYEGLMIERGADGRLVAWIISDENGAVSQRALLLKVVIDEALLPAKQKAPGSTGRP